MGIVIAIIAFVIVFGCCFASIIREYPEYRRARNAKMSPSWPIGFGKGPGSPYVSPVLSMHVKKCDLDREAS